mmetsp:Transcript_33352/g.74298  ORF Transcript_33352/g.74298 Transcript_33352/m.74298 type:complete len:1101 (+) Transcript_33352:77-3379(+)
MAEECSVQVGVRIRPFNPREKNLGAELCVEMQGPMTIITPPPEADSKDDVGVGKPREREPKKFTFDASFWSHDGFEERGDGYLTAELGGRYADQQHVFDVFGKGVLDNAWLGYHCCLFAYGQTGSGKSYSMVGYGANKGIVPVSCEDIFRRIEANKDPNLTFEVTVSMVEIYNEQVQDLLVPARLRPKKGLEIRESQQLGIYIHGVAKRAVNTYPAIEAVLDEGTTNRTIGATLMNATSSRAHTVLTLEFKQVSTHHGQQGCKVSLINLVDLAGSEKAGQTGAQGDRLKEGCAINKSLSALGNVIEKLADRSTGKAKASSVIPYRDSKLTRLLQNALGGSSKTVMICAISPASTNYEETLSTLRYADRAKRIKNSAVVNENPQDRLIRQLREENQKLREMATVGVTEGSPQGTAELEMKQEEIAALEDALRDMQKSFDERLKEAQAKAREAKPGEKNKILNFPHLANLNEDQMLTNKLQFAFSELRTRIGKASDRSAGGSKATDPEVALAGPGIFTEHSMVSKKDGVCIMRTHPQAISTTFINGKNPPLKEGVALMHGDRVAFGSSLFVFVDPKQGSAAELLGSAKVSYASARKELSAQQGGVTGVSQEEVELSKKRAEELETLVKKAQEEKESAEKEAMAMVQAREEEHKKRVEALELDFARSLEEHAKAQVTGQVAAVQEQATKQSLELQRMQRDFEEQQRKREEAAQKRIQELESVVQKAAKEEDEHRQHQMNMQLLEEQLMHVMPLVKEANLIAEELKKPLRLETRMRVDLVGSNSHSPIQVTAAVLRDGVHLYEWTADVLENRVYLLRELLERCSEEGYEAAERLPKEDDPFWDPIEDERLIGVAHILLQGLLMQVENQLDARVYSTEGRQTGTLHLEVWPLGKDGTLGIPDEDAVDKPEDLIASRMDLMVKVGWAKGLPEELANDVRIEFSYFVDHRPHKVPSVPGHNCDPQFNFEERIVQDPVTSQFLEYLKTKSLVFHVYGRDTAAAKLADQEKGAKSQQQQPALADVAPAAAATPSTMPPQTGTSGGSTAQTPPQTQAPPVQAATEMNPTMNAVAQEPQPIPDHGGQLAQSVEQPPGQRPTQAQSKACCIL